MSVDLAEASAPSPISSMVISGGDATTCVGRRLRHLHSPGRLRENNPAENSHLPIRRRSDSSSCSFQALAQRFLTTPPQYTTLLRPQTSHQPRHPRRFRGAKATWSAAEVYEFGGLRKSPTADNLKTVGLGRSAQRISRISQITSAAEPRRPCLSGPVRSLDFRVAVSKAPLHQQHARRHHERETIGYGHRPGLRHYPIDNPKNEARNSERIGLEANR